MMTGGERVVQDFVREAARVLDQASDDIRRLAAQAYLSHDAVLAPDGPEADDRSQRLVQVARQFEKLSERSSSLSRYLASGMEAPPEDDDIWPCVRIVQSQEEERARLARNLEESVGQLLANAVVELASFRGQFDSEDQAADHGLSALQAELEQGLSDLRQLIVDLDPSSLVGNFGLVAGLRRYLEDYEVRTGLRSVLDVRTILERLPATVEVAIFRIVQEALENIRRHAQATQVEVSISQKDGSLFFLVTDDGVGLQMESVDSRGRSLGLVSMHDLAELLHGNLRLLSDEDQGTQLILSVPYPIS